MSEQIITQLEAAASIISAPPNIITNEQRRSAEELFLNFRKSESPYLVCKQIFETSHVPYVLFEASEVLKISLIREWAFLTQEETVSLRQYLMQYVFLKQDLPYFVQERILQVIAIMIKRASVEDFGQSLNGILTEIESIIVNGDHMKKILGCKLILNLLQEYSSTVKSTDVSLTWEFHFKAKKRFEGTNLTTIFSFSVRLFSEIIKNEPPFHSQTIQLMGSLLTIVANVLTWGYISPVLRKRLIGVYEASYESDQAPSLRLSPNWHNIIFAPDFLPLMFEVYWTVRNYDGLAHLAMTGLVQLATLNGAILTNDEEKLQYFNSYLENFIKLLDMIRLNFNNKEVLGISNIVRKLQLFFKLDCERMPITLLESYINNLTRVTCCFAEGAQIEEAQMMDDGFYMEAFDNVLEAWISIFQDSTLQENNSICNLLLQSATQIFNSYLQTHLAPPDGCRALTDNSEEIEDDKDNDRCEYKDQLQVIGMCGRLAISSSLPLLLRLLEDRSEKLKSRLQVIKTETMTLNDSVILDNLFEDIHWIILIAGHILCMDSEGETPMIPTEVMQYSIQQCNTKKANLESTLRFIANIRLIEFQTADTNECDAAIQVFGNVLKMCLLESSAAAVKLGHFLSPELGCTLMWFLKRWCVSYLLLNEQYYHEISETFSGSMGKDTDAAAFITSFVLEKIHINITNFSSEPVLLKDTVDLFINIVQNKPKCQYIIKTESLWNIVKLQLESKPGSLPQQVRRGLFKGLILAGSAINDQDESDEYYAQIINPLKIRFKNITLMENFNQIYQEEYVKVEIIDILESLIGLAAGTQISSAPVLFQSIIPILSELPAYLNIYKNYQVIVQLILESFGFCARHMLSYLSHNDSKQLYECSLSTVKVYAEVNFNRFSTETYSEESSYQDILLVLEFLTFILCKDYLDLSPDNFDVEASVSACDVSLYGLKFILPLIKMDLLMYPSFCTQFYKLIVSINELCPDKIAGLSDEMLQQLLYSLELGITKGFGLDIVQTSLDFIQGLAQYIYKNCIKESKIYNVLRPFLKLIIDLTLRNEIPSEIIPTASVCIYSLICCYRPEYDMIINNFIESQSDPRVAERLADAFSQLNANAQFNCQHQAQLKFRDSFDNFVANACGFLLVK